MKNWLSIVALFWTLVGCCPHRYTEPASPLSHGPDLLKKLQSATTHVKSLEYVSRVEFYSDDGVQKGDVEILGRRANQLRFEAVTPTGDTVAVLISDGKRFVSHERGKSECYVGDACAANVSRLLPLAMEGADVMEVLSGGVPLIEYTSTRAQWESCEGAYKLVLTQAAQNLVQTIWIRPDTYHPIRAEVRRDGQLKFELSWSEHQRHKKILVPGRITFKSPRRSVDFSLEIREHWINQVDDTSVFNPQCPAGTTTKELLCQ